MAVVDIASAKRSVSVSVSNADFLGILERGLCT